MENSENKQEKKYWISLILTCFMIVLAQFVTIFHRNSSGVLQQSLLAEFGLSTMQYALFTSMYFYPYVIMQMPMGILADKIGPKKSITYGMFLTAIGTILFSTANSYAVICISRVLIGIGVSCPISCGSKLYANWFKQKYVATGSGIVSLISGVLGMLGQSPLAIAVGYFGWRNTYMTICAGTVVIAVLCIFFMHNSPESLGMKSVAQMDGIVRVQKPKISIKVAIKSVISNKYLYPIIPMMFVMMGTYQMFASTWAIPYITNGFAKTTVEAASFTKFMVLGTAVSGFVVTFVSDKVKSRKYPMLFQCALMAVCWCMISIFPDKLNDSNMGALMFLMGFTQGFVPLVFAEIRELNDPDYAGTAVGFCNMLGMAGSCVMPAVIASLMEKNTAKGLEILQVYTQSFKVCVILVVIAFICILFMKDTKCKNIYDSL